MHVTWRPSVCWRKIETVDMAFRALYLINKVESSTITRVDKSKVHGSDSCVRELMSRVSVPDLTVGMGRRQRPQMLKNDLVEKSGMVCEVGRGLGQDIASSSKMEVQPCNIAKNDVYLASNPNKISNNVNVDDKGARSVDMVSLVDGRSLNVVQHKVEHETGTILHCLLLKNGIF
ncbi:hypothetical protein V6N11_072108 [Hibiscus sabdariffa]|uniref:Uncharacterized protein n=1 Tax=Hibiscus sabdariffa TaxID=183260 RepID=A0ABR2U2W0_9ROSI